MRFGSTATDITYLCVRSLSAAARTYKDQRDDQRFVVQIVNDIRVRFDKRPGEVYALTGIPGADLRQSFFVHLDHVQLEIRPEPLVVELDHARQTAYFDLCTTKQNTSYDNHQSYKYRNRPPITIFM